MPLVKRTIQVENNSTTYTKSTVEHVHYVPPKAVRPDDIVVEPSSDRQLAELAEQYPEEFGALAESRNVKPGHESQIPNRVAELRALPAKDLVKEIDATDAESNEELLYALLEAELGDDGANRSSVVAALARKGIEG